MSYENLKAIIESWAIQRHTITQQWQNGASGRSLNEFVQTQDAMTKRLMVELQTEAPEFYSALAELATNVDGILARGKVHINGSRVR